MTAVGIKPLLIAVILLIDFVVTIVVAAIAIFATAICFLTRATSLTNCMVAGAAVLVGAASCCRC